MKPVTKKSKITRAMLESIVIPPDSNMVIVEIPHQNKDTVTKSGIIVVGDQDYKPANHAERWGYIYKLPPNLYYKRGDINSIQWKTEIECEVGDKVWFDFRAALHAETYETDGVWYKVLYYDNLYVAQRGETIIPLNGYLLLKEYTPPKESEFMLDVPVDDRFGIVVKAGRPNDEYILPFWDDKIEVNDGDHVLFEKGTTCFPVESDMHKEFSEGKFLLQHRKRVLAVVDKEHNQIIRLHEGAFGAKMNPKKEAQNGVLLSGDVSKQRVGRVLDSAHPSIGYKSVVVTSKQKGTEFHGIEYFAEDKIYYYETSC